MDSIQLESLLNAYNINYKNTWEQVRFIAYIQASCFSKISKPQDIIKFKWDEIEHEDLTPEQLEQQKKEVLKYALSIADKLE